MKIEAREKWIIIDIILVAIIITVIGNYAMHPVSEDEAWCQGQQKLTHTSNHLLYYGMDPAGTDNVVRICFTTDNPAEVTRMRQVLAANFKDFESRNNAYLQLMRGEK